MEIERWLRLWAPTLLLILGASLVLGLIFPQLAEQSRVLLAVGGASQESIDGDAEAVEVNDSAPAEPASIDAAPAAAAGKRWTVLEASSAIESVAIDARPLIAAGLSELPEFADLSSEDAVRAGRDRHRFAAWGRIWRNRVELLSDRMPPTTDCRRHTAILEACRELRTILGNLDDIASSRDLETASDQLSVLDQRLELLLAPPPEPDLDPSTAEDTAN